MYKDSVARCQTILQRIPHGDTVKIKYKPFAILNAIRIAILSREPLIIRRNDLFNSVSTQLTLLVVVYVCKYTPSPSHDISIAAIH